MVDRIEEEARKCFLQCLERPVVPQQVLGFGTVSILAAVSSDSSNQFKVGLPVLEGSPIMSLEGNDCKAPYSVFYFRGLEI